MCVCCGQFMEFVSTEAWSYFFIRHIRWLLSLPSMRFRFDTMANNNVRQTFMCWYQSDFWTINWRGTYLLAYFDQYRGKRMDNRGRNWHLQCECDGSSTNSNWIALNEIYFSQLRPLPKSFSSKTPFAFRFSSSFYLSTTKLQVPLSQ